MKLIFPNGEHEPVALHDGVTQVGSGSDCQVMLAAPGIAVRHCEIHTKGEQSMVRPAATQAVTVLNGKQINADTQIKAGDLLLFGKIGCRVVAMERSPAPPLPVRKLAPGEDDGRTRVRMALPKFLLRGVSGPTFGKTFAMVGSMTVGRNSDCDICIPTDEISRHHAKLQVVPDGVMVEDLGSANGTFANNQRVHGSTLLKAGEELRFDTVRFLLMSPGMDTHPQPAAQPRTETPQTARPASSVSALWIVAGVVVLITIVLGVLHFLDKL